MRSSIASLFLALLVCAGASAADGANKDIDDPFNTDGPIDTVADPTQKVNPDLLSSKSMKFFEKVKADAYSVTGWTKEYNQLVSTPYNALAFTFGTDVRVDKTVRAYAAFQVTYPNSSSSTNTTSTYNPYSNLVPSDGKLEFSSLLIQELFMDYTLFNQVFFRVGRQTQTWGQGRIFNPGNFVNDIADGVALKAATTVCGANFTGMVIKNDSYYNSSGNATSIYSLAFMGMVESSIGGLNWGLSGFYQKTLGLKADCYLKSSLAGTDYFTEGVVEKASVDSGDYIPSVVIGAYHEFGDEKKWLKAEVEYLFSARGMTEAFNATPKVNYGWNDQSVGIVCSSDILSFLSTKPNLTWLTALKDQSGELIFGVTNTAIPHLELSAGVVYIYGSLDSRYVIDNPDSSEKRRLSFTLKASFSLDSDQ